MITLLVSLIRVLWAFVEGILKVAVYLLRVFGLIVPLVYLAACLILNVALDNALFTNRTYLGLFYAGLVLSLVGAVVLFFRNTVRAPFKNFSLNKRERDLQKWEEELSAREAALSAREAVPARNEQAPAQAPAPGQPYAGVQPGFQAAVQTAPQNFSGTPSFSGPSAVQGGGYGGFQSSQPLSGTPNTAAYQGGLMGEGAHAVSPQPIPPDWEETPPRASSEPEIYRVRQNPEYLLYDYGDHIDLYRETRRGLRFVRRDRKEGDERRV